MRMRVCVSVLCVLCVLCMYAVYECVCVCVCVLCAVFVSVCVRVYAALHFSYRHGCAAGHGGDALVRQQLVPAATSRGDWVHFARMWRGGPQSELIRAISRAGRTVHHNPR